MLKSSRFWVFVLLFTVLMLSFSPRNFLADFLTTDPASYHSHAFTLGLDFDLDYSNEPWMCLNSDSGMPCHPIGAGLFAAPFVFVFSQLDQLSGDPVLSDHRNFQYSWSFFGYSLSHSVYFVAGLWLFTMGLVRAGVAIARWRVLLYAASFGMAYYTLQSVQMSHVYQFFALAMSFWAAAGMWRAFEVGRSALVPTLLAAVAVVLTIAIRPADVVAIALPGIVFFTLWAVRRDGDRALAGGALRVALSYLVAVAAAYTPLAWFNWAIYGSVFPTPGQMYGGTLVRLQRTIDALPQSIESAATEVMTEPVASSSLAEDAGVVWDNFLSMLFSSEFGVLYTSPIFLFGSVALLVIVLIRHRNIPLTALNLLTIVAYLAIPIAVVLYWRTTASFYGYRYLFPIFPLALLGYALFIRHYLLVDGYRHTRAAKYLVEYALLAFCVLALLSQIFYGSSEALALHEGVNVFNRWHHLGAYGYVPNLLESIASPSAWVHMVAHRMPGFIVAELMQWLSVDLGAIGAALGIPADSLETGLARYSDLPARAVVQVFAVFLFNLVAICLFLRGCRLQSPMPSAPPADAPGA